jgi:hypothetical protein
VPGPATRLVVAIGVCVLAGCLGMALGYARSASDRRR